MEANVKAEIQCTRCGAVGESHKEGFGWRAGKRVQRYRCKVCGAVFVPETKEKEGIDGDQ